jgi:hypothetical protein
MNKAKEYQRTTTDAKWPIATALPVDKKNKIALAITAMAMLAVGSIVLFYYPLETMIVALFIGSVFVLDRK